MTTSAPLPIFHYIYDPLCGWCYAAAPLVHAVHDIPGLGLRLHGGGMMSGAQRQPVTTALRDYVMPHDQRIHGLTGQPFGDAYFNGLLRDTGAVFDSTPPITAVLAADAVPGAAPGLALRMLARIQHAHYVEGKRIAESEVLAALAEDIGIPCESFRQAWDACTGEPTDQHIARSRHLLGQLGGHGFPTLALEQDGRYARIDISAWLGRPDEFREMLAAHLGMALPAAEADGPVCGPEGC